MRVDARHNVAKVNRCVDEMLVLVVYHLEVIDMNNDWILDVLEKLRADVHNGFVIDSLHLNIQVEEVLIILQPVLNEVEIVAALTKCLMKG